MDGFKRRLNESVQLKLSFTLSLAILVVAVVAGTLSFASAFEEAHELQDDVLRQVAQLMDSQRLLPALPPAAPAFRSVDEDARVIVQGLDAGAARPADVLPFPSTLADGLYTLDVRGKSYRALVKTAAEGRRFIVAQELEFRNNIARDGALRTVAPLLLLMPILLLVVADLIRKMFRPIARLSKEIDGRDEQALHAVDHERLPIEVRPFAVAINQLLARVGQAMASQRRFVADAAHELRSPLTALSLQAERLAEADMPEDARARVATLRRGIERGRNLVDQLLALARAQSNSETPTLPLSVKAVYRRVLEDLVPLAEARQIDIGIEGTQDVQVRASELDMIALVRNLADNAIRYAMPGGRVDLSVGVWEGHAVLRVRDDGPGIRPAEWHRVFDPFYRTLGTSQVGSGLGLSIVHAIAERIGARIELGFTDEASQTGLSVKLTLPLAAAQGEARGLDAFTPTGADRPNPSR